MLSYKSILGCFIAADLAAISIQFSVVLNGIFVVSPAGLLNFSRMYFAQVQLLSRQNILFFSVITLGGAQTVSVYTFIVIEMDILMSKC